MFVTVLLAASMLALERSENAYSRLVRGLVTPGRLLWGKIILAGALRGAVALVMSLLLGLFVHLSWGRLPLWIACCSFRPAAFGALGVAVGALAREVSVASLLGFAVALPVAFVALVPSSAVSGALQAVLDARVVPVSVPPGAQRTLERVQRRGAGDRAAAAAPRGARLRVLGARAAGAPAVRRALSPRRFSGRRWCGTSPGRPPR